MEVKCAICGKLLYLRVDRDGNPNCVQPCSCQLERKEMETGTMREHIGALQNQVKRLQTQLEGAQAEKEYSQKRSEAFWKHLEATREINEEHRQENSRLRDQLKFVQGLLLQLVERAEA